MSFSEFSETQKQRWFAVQEATQDFYNDRMSSVLQRGLSVLAEYGFDWTEWETLKSDHNRFLTTVALASAEFVREKAFPEVRPGLASELLLALMRLAYADTASVDNESEWL